MKTPVIAVCGPTGTGKTDLGIHIAKVLGSEIVSVDSMQVYMGLDIGTAKPGRDELLEVPHHLIGFLSPKQKYSVAEYKSDATRAIDDIWSRKGVPPILVGGTGLYLQSLLDNIEYLADTADNNVRHRLTQELEGLGAQAMYEKLKLLDPEIAAKLHPNNTGRVIRALEVMELTGITMTEYQRRAKEKEGDYNALLIGLDLRDRALLYERIDLRVDRMMEEGLLEEARLVYNHRDGFITAAAAIGYKEFFPFFAGELELEESVESLKTATRRYAKRQLTWFRKMEGISWLYLEDYEDKDALYLAADMLIAQFER